MIKKRLLFCFILIGCLSFTNPFSYERIIDSSNVLDDLLEDDNFRSDLKSGLYDFNLKNEIKLIDVAEYNYQLKKEDFGLYIYVFNSNQSKNILENSNCNKIALFQNGSNNKYNLDFVNKTIDNKFYKFEVKIDSEFFNGLDKDCREYRFTSIELINFKETNAIDYKIGNSYKFSGSSKTSNLSLIKEEFETLTLDVNVDYYRSHTSSKGQFFNNDLFYAYFSIPNAYLDKYGGVTNVHADFEKYSLKELYIIEEKGRDFNLNYDWYNHFLNNGFKDGFYGYCKDPLLPVVGPAGGFISDSNRIPKANQLINKVRQAWDLIELDDYIKANLDLINLNSKEYFNLNYSSLDSFDLLSYDPNLYEKWLSDWFGIYTDSFISDIKDIKIIEKLPNKVIDLNDNLLVNPGRISNVNDFIKSSYNGSSEPYILRFDVGESFNSNFGIFNFTSGGYVPQKLGQAYLGQMIKNFDVLDLTFANSEVKTVVPIINNPKDIIPGIDNIIDNDQFFKLLKIIFITLAVLLGIYLILKLATFIKVWSK